MCFCYVGFALQSVCLCVCVRKENSIEVKLLQNLLHISCGNVYATDFSCIEVASTKSAGFQLLFWPIGRKMVTFSILLNEIAKNMVRFVFKYYKDVV